MDENYSHLIFCANWFLFFILFSLIFLAKNLQQTLCIHWYKDIPALITTDHETIVVLKVTNASRHAAFILIFAFICTRGIVVLALRYNGRVARHVFNINKCTELVRHGSRLRYCCEQSRRINCIVVIISLQTSQTDDNETCMQTIWTFCSPQNSVKQ